MNDSRPAFLTDDLDWILFGGKGGVGKTTCAVAAALHRVQREGERVRLLSTDPAHSIRDSLAGSAPPDRLTVQEFDAESALSAFREQHREILHEIVSRGTLFDDEDIGRLLDLGLPGLDELMAFLHLGNHLDPAPADTLVIDTAPTGHTLRLLDTPDLFRAWLGVLDAMLEKHRTMKAAFARAAGPDALDSFIEDMTARAERVASALRDPVQCRFVGVTQAEPLVLAETVRLADALADRDLPVREWLVNKLPWGTDGPASGAVRPLHAHRDRLTAFGLWGLPAYEAEVQGRDRLLQLWDDVVLLDLDGPDDSSAPDAGAQPTEPPAVPRSLPTPKAQFLLVAGKGGVGKTTMACATALYLADQRSGDDVMLLSTDPAHSLSTALGHSLGDTPTRVAPGLDALEIDATARFNALREAYVDEVRQFFRQATGERVDLTYDRPVMERLLDLAPPGVDEMMGWTTAMDVLDDDQYGVCVLDAAPTGHFVRLLEMPHLTEEWLRAFFHILQKYKQVIRLPTLSDRLVRLSKQTKRVRSMLEGEGGAVYGVTLPTDMALAETRDLVEHAKRLDVELPAVILNRVPPEARGENGGASVHTDAYDAFRDDFSAQAKAVVTDGRPPQGIEALHRLGRHLYSE